MSQLPFNYDVLVKAPLPVGEGLFTYGSRIGLPFGASVEVPLGKNNRTVQGFVLASGAMEYSKEIGQWNGQVSFLPRQAAWTHWLWSHYLLSARTLLQHLLQPQAERDGRLVRLLLNEESCNRELTRTKGRPSFQQLLEELRQSGGSALLADLTQRRLVPQAARKGWVMLEAGYDPGAGPSEAASPSPGGLSSELIWCPWREQLERLIVFMEELRQERQQVLLLVPEVSLLPTVAQLLADRGLKTQSYYGGIGRQGQALAYRLARADRSAIVIGSWRALFLPFLQLGGVFVLQEGSEGYRLPAGLVFSVGPAAQELARCHVARLALFSRAPSLEAYLRTYQGLALRWLPADRAPQRDLVIQNPRMGLAPAILARIRIAQKHHRRSLVYVNRLGYANALVCRDCGATVRCPSCDVALSVHQERLVCHYCSFHSTPPTRCSQCGSKRLQALGTGIERVEEQLSRELPQALLLRLDSERVRDHPEVEEVLQRFRREPSSILLATSRLRGLSLPSIDCLVLLNLDLALRIPHYRATERAYQLLANLEPLARGALLIQVSSRWGIERLLEEGPAFYREELQVRKQAQFPPAVRLMQFRFEGPLEEATWQAATQMRERLQGAGFGGGLVGPIEALPNRLRGLWRVELLLRLTRGPIPENLRPLVAFFSPKGQVTYSAQIDLEA